MTNVLLLEKWFLSVAACLGLTLRRQQSKDTSSKFRNWLSFYLVCHVLIQASVAVLEKFGNRETSDRRLRMKKPSSHLTD